MHRRYLGDSYDAVKRLWQQVLAPWAPLYAIGRFIPDDVQRSFTHLTGIPIANVAIIEPHSLLNDPDTGIRLPGRPMQSEGKHVTLNTIVGQLRDPLVSCVVTFDQSNYRNHGSVKSQRLLKLNALHDQGIHSFYYASHASFLFSTRNAKALQKVKSLVRSAGIPEARLELAR